MKNFLKYAVAAVSVAALVAPFAVLAAPIVQPTVPVGGRTITATDVTGIVQNIVNFLVTISAVVSVGVIVYGGLRYMQDPEKGKTILKQGIFGIVIILGVGLILNTIAGLINRGGSIY